MRYDTLYVSDMDGTLLGTDSRISPRSSEIITGLSRRGASITVATARTAATVEPLLRGTYTTPPAIVITGCARWNRTDSTYSQLHLLPEHEMLRAMEICRHHGVHPFVYVIAEDGRTLDVYHGAGALNRAEDSFYLERANLPLKRFHLGTPAPPRALHHTILFYSMGPAGCIQQAAEAVRAESQCEVCCYPDIFNPDVYNFEVFPPGVNKAAAVSRLRRDMDKTRLVVFGDNLNDLSMMAEADVAVAVANALPEVRAAADIVIDPNYTDAVARFIADDFLR